MRAPGREPRSRTRARNRVPGSRAEMRASSTALRRGWGAAHREALIGLALRGAAALAHQIAECAEPRTRVVRAGTGLRMVLAREHRQAAVDHALERVIVAAEMSGLELSGRQRFEVHEEPVILRGH